jgi:hypothetical protein
MQKTTVALLAVFNASCSSDRPPGSEHCDLSIQPQVDMSVVADFSIPVDLFNPDLANPEALPTPRIPGDFNPEAEKPGLRLYKRTATGMPLGEQDFYVLIVDITKYDLKSAFGEINPGEERPTDGIYGGPDPLINRLSVVDWQNKLGNTLFFSGQFFDSLSPRPRLSYGVTEEQVDGMGRKIKVRLADGADTDIQWADKKMILEVKPGVAAQILSYSVDNFKDPSRPPTSVVGLSEDAPKRPDEYLGRTYIGTGTKVEKMGSVMVDYRLLYVFVSTGSTQLRAAATLHRFGAVEVMMLDGGGSVKLSVDKIAKVMGASTTPHALALYPRP